MIKIEFAIQAMHSYILQVPPLDSGLFLQQKWMIFGYMTDLNALYSLPLSFLLDSTQKILGNILMFTIELPFHHCSIYYILHQRFQRVPGLIIERDHMGFVSLVQALSVFGPAVFCLSPADMHLCSSARLGQFSGRC